MGVESSSFRRLKDGMGERREAGEHFGAWVNGWRKKRDDVPFLSFVLNVQRSVLTAFTRWFGVVKVCMMNGDGSS